MMREAIKRKLAFFLFIFLYLISYFSLWTQSYKKFEYFSREQGLSQSVVSCIIQDRRGFLWIGTHDGLNMYDGYECKVFQHDPKNPGSISCNIVMDLMEDRFGNIWIGTYLGGLNKYDPTTGRFVHYKKEANKTGSLKSNLILTIVEGSDNDMWIGTPEVLYRFDPEGGHFSPFQLNIIVSSIYKDSNGYLWLGGVRSGLVRFNPADGSTTFFRKNPGSSAGINDNDIKGICPGPNGSLWIGTSGGGLLQFDIGKQTFTPYFNNGGNPALGGISFVSAIAPSEIRSSVLWAATAGGLIEFDMEKKCVIDVQAPSLRADCINSNDLFSVFEDREGTLWVGAYGSGLNKYIAKKSVFRSYRHHPCLKNSIGHDLVFSVIEDRNGYIWVGSLGGGLDRIDRATSQITNYRYDSKNPNCVSSNFIRSLCLDSSGYIWIGTDGAGLNRFDPKKNKFEHFRHEPGNENSIADDIIRKVFVDHSGIVWICTSHIGLDSFNPEKGIFHHFRHVPTDTSSISDNSLRCIMEDRNHTLWIGTSTGGLNRFERVKKTFVRYKADPDDPYSISSNGVFSIHEDSNGVLWVGTNGGGLNRFDRESGTFQWITTTDGLPNNVIYGILEDDSGSLWLSTSNELAQYDPKSGVIRTFGIDDGLPSVEFCVGAYCRAASGELFYGGIKGLVSFFPKDIATSSYIPPVQFTDFKVMNRDYGLRAHISEVDQLNLSYKDTFLFEFSALSFVSPRQNRYAYKLAGFNEDWVPLGHRRMITFAHLAPGSYELRVKGSNADGIWNEEGASIRLVIEPPIWQTWWFKLMVVFLVFGLAYYLHTIKLKNTTLKLKTESALNRLFGNYKLSGREQEIANLIMKGKSNKDIEDKLFISINTVKSHVYSIYRKMGVKNRLDMINLVQKSIGE